MSCGADEPATQAVHAGATGVTGQALVKLCDARGVAIVPHVRPRHAATDPRAAAFELTDAEALTKVLRGCTTVMQLIGTMRKRFAAGDTYESSDIGTTRLLVEAATRARTIDHIVLLGSVGAGKPRGAYLRAKAEAERIVRESGLPFTIFRPSFLSGPGRRPPPGAGALSRVLGLTRWQPITVVELASALLQVAIERAALGQVLEGDALWQWVPAEQSAGGPA